jgi:hypothetical protein
MCADIKKWYNFSKSHWTLWKKYLENIYIFTLPFEGGKDYKTLPLVSFLTMWSFGGSL